MPDGEQFDRRQTLVTRRNVIGAVAGAVVLPLGGCNCGPPPAGVVVRLDRETRLRREGDEWHLAGGVTARFYLETERTVADLRLVFRGEDGSELGEHGVGDLRPSAATESDGRCGGRVLRVSFEATSGGYPHTIGFRTEAGVDCDDETLFIGATLREDEPAGQEGTIGDYYRTRRCPGAETPTAGTDRASSTATGTRRQ